MPSVEHVPVQGRALVKSRNAELLSFLHPLFNPQLRSSLQVSTSSFLKKKKNIPYQLLNTHSISYLSHISSKTGS